jgi:tight adherence protein C
MNRGDFPAPAISKTEVEGPLARWLERAGFRSPQAPAQFLVASALAVCAAVAMLAALYLTGLVQASLQAVANLPGGLGDLFLPLVVLAPWLLGLGVSGLPALVVYQARQRVVRSVQRDLPLTLELLATLSEAGLAFDSALSRIQQTRLAEGWLAQQWRNFQTDLLAGRTRVESLRQLADRVDLPPVSMLVAALIQAEQLGSGLSAVLRQQADDLRDRRRQQAHALAMTLPVKRVVPLVICFLPGLFVWVLGPFFVHLFQVADALTRVRNMVP